MPYQAKYLAKTESVMYGEHKVTPPQTSLGRGKYARKIALRDRLYMHRRLKKETESDHRQQP
jgi:hypothetical protein